MTPRCATCLFRAGGLYKVKVCRNPEALRHNEEVKADTSCKDWADKREHVREN